MLGIFETHPVQYRAPVYRELAGLTPPESFHVFYATDTSLRGKRDEGFGTTVAWDVPLLEGYPNSVIFPGQNRQTHPVTAFLETGRLMERHRLSGVLLTDFRRSLGLPLLLQANIKRLPVWIRQETQDEAFVRNGLKSMCRDMCYRFLYSRVEHAFAIGELNRGHLLRHGMPKAKISMSRYCAPDRFIQHSADDIKRLGQEKRASLGINTEELVIGFFGKLISKKDPLLLLEAVQILNKSAERPLRILFVGSGELEEILRSSSAKLESLGIRTSFAGFVNQSSIAEYYAATDILALPSRRMGETWGLVVNEGIQAGCSVAMSNAVGCHAEFGRLPHCRIFRNEDAGDLAVALSSLISNPPPDRAWSRAFMDPYSTRSAAKAIAVEISRLAPRT
jgi:glycosyltransferase involved in cell wall biosynthesis